MSHVVVVESQVSRAGELIRAGLDLGHEMTFVTSDLAFYLRGGRTLAETGLDQGRIVEGASTGDPEGLAAIVLPLAAEHPVHAIFTSNDHHLLATATVAARLGLRHTPLSAVELVRDKFRCREQLARHGIAQPPHRLAEDPDAAVRAADELGYPVVVKPVDGAASLNVGVAADAAAVRRYAEAVVAQDSYGRSTVARRHAVVETYLPGPLVSVETFSSGGRHVVLGLTDRQLTPLPAQVELGGCFPAPVREAQAAIALCCAALDAVGFTTGTAQTEIVLHADGPRIIEINGRLAGGMMPFVMGAALQRSLQRDVIELWLHGSLPALPVPRQVAAIQTIVADRSGTIAAIEPSPHAGDADVLDYILHKAVGDPIRPPRDNRDRVGSVICVGPTAEAARAKARQVIDSTAIRIDEDAPVAAGAP